MGEFQNQKEENRFADINLEIAGEPQRLSYATISKVPLAEEGLSHEALEERREQAAVELADRLSNELGREVSPEGMLRFAAQLERTGHSIHLEDIPNRDERRTKTLECIAREMDSVDGVAAFVAERYQAEEARREEIEKRWTVDIPSQAELNRKLEPMGISAPATKEGLKALEEERARREAAARGEGEAPERGGPQLIQPGPPWRVVLRRLFGGD